jgi:hypothetical protein
MRSRFGLGILLFTISNLARPAHADELSPKARSVVSHYIRLVHANYSERQNGTASPPCRRVRSPHHGP